MMLLKNQYPIIITTKYPYVHVPVTVGIHIVDRSFVRFADLPGLTTRLVDQLCRGRCLTGLLTCQHGGPAGLTVVHLVL